MRTLFAALVAPLLAGALVLGTAPATAASTVMPGDFTGYAFDACDAPSQKAMDNWRTHSKFAGVGIYIAGMNRACDAQPHLTKSWVRTQSRKGWHLLPLVVGRQASCAPQGLYVGKRISPKKADGYAKARRQGRAAATAGAKAARRLGIARSSVLWFDLEHFDVSKTRCRRSALTFTSGWTRRLHALHYRSGFYSSASSGIAAMEGARVKAPGVYALPDYLWIAEWNGKASVRSAYIPAKGWWPHRRVHQYRGGHDERHGGSRLNIDSNFLRTGKGTVAGRSAPHCGVKVSFGTYRALDRGDRGRKVRAAQCLLRQAKNYHGKIDSRFDKQVARSVRRFQRGHQGVPTSGRVTKRTWAALLSDGPRPLTKFGDGGNEVRRLQRALNAATEASLTVDGRFAAAEATVVRRYQRRSGRTATGVVDRGTWRLLQRGRVVGRLTASSSIAERLGLAGLLGWDDAVEHSIGADR